MTKLEFGRIRIAMDMMDAVVFVFLNDEQFKDFHATVHNLDLDCHAEERLRECQARRGKP